MKFYYNNKLVRTSKTHNYKYGVFTSNDKLLACASSFELAQKAIITATNSERHNLEFYKKELEAIEKGKEKFWGKKYLHKVEDTKEECEEIIKRLENYLSGIHIEELKAE